MNSKIITYQPRLIPIKSGLDRGQQIEELSIVKKKKVLVGGCFDIFHIGHLTFLKEAKKHGEMLIVALESDEFIRKKKQREPFHTQYERAEILAACEIVDIVILLPFFTSSREYGELVDTIKPHVIAITEGDPHTNYKKQHAEKIGASVATVTPKIPGHGSTAILTILNGS
ncbi:MAG TPA: adenylyltransferase/cytidyltransferase family protein [Patescibacteria group bacterium]|nr:adenylyltransferase/cytidyltransferase family protein [Patescibacteria group bacterium]